ncbi:hypothetical protein [Bacillus sp. P14.5]|uniref:hypothetical protein n=1 Tax=Bacillus sp. P14.5 TaxID=1983400 RepID=UPI0031F5582C
MNRIASLPLGFHIINFLGREESSPSLSRFIDGISFSNPVGLSGKVDPELSGTRAFTNLGFGFLEIGPVSLTRMKSLSAPAVDNDQLFIQFPEDESAGVDSVKEKLKNIKKKQPIFIRLAGSSRENQTMIDQLAEAADGFIVEDSYTDLATKKPMYLSTSDPSMVDFVKIQHYSGIVLELNEKFSNESILMVKELRERGYSNTIITSGSVTEPEDALQLLDAGANLVMLSGGYVFSGPGLTKRIKEALVSREQPAPPPQGWYAYWLFGLFIFLGGMLALLFSLTSILLPYDELFLGVNREDIWAYNERIMLFMAHDRMTLAGTMISGGIVYMNLAKHGVKKQLKWAKQAIDAAAILGFLGIFRLSALVILIGCI